MDATQLYQELRKRNIHLYVDAEGTLHAQAPRNALSAPISAAIRAHKEEILATLTPSQQVEQVTVPGGALTEQEYYASCVWYHADEGPAFSQALEYAFQSNLDLCNAYASNRLITFYRQCQERSLLTEQGRVNTSPMQLTQRLHLAYMSKNTNVLGMLATNFHQAERVDEILLLLAENTPEEDIVPRQDTANDQRAEQKRTPRRQSIYADVMRGIAVTPQGKTVFPPGADLLTLVQFLQLSAEHTHLFLCGQLPENYNEWLLSADMFDDYTTAKRGHFLDKEKEESHVVRYAHRISGQEIEIRSMAVWGMMDCSPEDAAAAIDLLNQYLKAQFKTEQAHTYATPALTFQTLWKMLNRMEKRSFEPLPEDIRALIHGHTGQGRIELLTHESIHQLDGLHYYDGIFEYAALSWGMPTGIQTHDNENIYAGKVPARYRIQYTVPEAWTDIGVFMTPREQLTGNDRDGDAWCYPGENERGRTFETWVDGAELDVLIEHYAGIPKNATPAEKQEAQALGLARAFPAWHITILERIVFSVDSSKKPLDTITKRLVSLREKVEKDAEEDTARGHLYKLVRGAIRNILLHGIGSFHRNTRDITYILREDEPAPDEYISVRPLEDGRYIYTVPQKTEAYTQQFEHPEWSSLIWARCRARMLRAALSLPRWALIAIRTDAICTSIERPEWNGTKVGTLRPKWHISKKLPAPHSMEALDTLIHKHVKDAA